MPKIVTLGDFLDKNEHVRGLAGRQPNRLTRKPNRPARKLIRLARKPNSSASQHSSVSQTAEPESVTTTNDYDSVSYAEPESDSTNDDDDDTDDVRRQPSAVHRRSG